MAFHTIIIYAIVLGALSLQVKSQRNNATFDTFYAPLWGGDHLAVDPQGTEVTLTLDNVSGAGFRSKLNYGSGLFRIKMKTPENKTRGGVITSFYLTSLPNNETAGRHFEFDFEFLGTQGRLKTNAFNQDIGRREQVFQLGFDPSANFHTYEFLWNSHQIVFFIDSIPVRVFKNNTADGLAMYPSRAMYIEGSMWLAGEWSGPADMRLAPFVTHYRDFEIEACVPARSNNITGCNSGQFSWNAPEFWQLNATQQQQMNDFRSSFLIRDYCGETNRERPECEFNV